MMPHIDLLAIAGMVAGLGGSSMLAAFGDSVDALAPGYGKKAVAVVSILSFAAGLILRTHVSNSRTATAGTPPS
jgi:hypothetical protein